MTDLLIAGATVVACDPAGRVIPGGGVAVSGGRIAAVLLPDALPAARGPSPRRGLSRGRGRRPASERALCARVLRIAGRHCVC